MDQKGEPRMGAVLKKYNIRDTKRFYTEINTRAQAGQEIITYDGSRGSAPEVSHIKTALLDRVFSSFPFRNTWTFDEDLGVWTVSLDDLNLYGEGQSKNGAIEDLINSVLEYLQIYYANPEWFLSREETAPHYVYLRRIARCDGDKDTIKRLMGLEDAD